MIFELQQDLILPKPGSTDTAPRGFDLYPKALFGISYSLTVQPQGKTIAADIFVARKSDGEQVMAMPEERQVFTAEGRDGTTVVNEAEYRAYVDHREQLIVQLQTVNDQLNSLIRQLAQPGIEAAEITRLREEMEAKRQELRTLDVELSGLHAVTPVYEKVLTYDEVVNFFDPKTGDLTPAAAPWLPKLQLKGRNIADFIVLPNFGAAPAPGEGEEGGGERSARRPSKAS